MADIEFGDFDMDDAPARGRTFQNVANWAGAVTSVTLVVGLAVWGYQLTMRDVTGVPVVRALDGPMRIAPENPGGRQTEHQGLAVNRVAAEGEAAPPADRLVLAPRPVELADEDMPRPVPRVQEAPAAAPAALSAAAADDSAIAAPDPVAAALALADQLTEGETPLAPDDVSDSAGTELLEDAAPAPEIVAASVPGVARSPRPARRPEGDLAVQEALAAATAAVSTPVRAEEVTADVVPAGANLVQLGAYDSPEVARTEWQRLSARFDSFMDGKQRLIQSAESGGRTFYRLRAVGFSDISDARRFCAALTAERADCIPVVAR